MSAWACVPHKLYFIEHTSGLGVHRDLNFSWNCKPLSIKRSHTNKTENTHKRNLFYLLISYWYFILTSYISPFLRQMHLQIHKGVWRRKGIQRNTDHILINTTAWAKDTFNYILPGLFFFFFFWREGKQATTPSPKGQWRTKWTKPSTEREIYTSPIFKIYIPTVLPTLQSQVLLQSDPKHNLGQWW